MTGYVLKPLLYLRFGTSLTGFGHNLQIKSIKLLRFGLGDKFINLSDMNNFTICLINTVSTVKVPVITAFR